MPAPRPVRPARGVTLIELMIGLAVLALLLLSGAPAFADWLRNVRIRSAGESLLSGLQFARTEAVRRNTATRFQLTTTLDNGCALSAAGQNWVVNLDKAINPNGKCGAGLVPGDGSAGVVPYLLQKASLGGGSAGLQVNMDRNPAVVAFNGLGEQTSVDGMSGADVTLTISSSQGSCAQDGGTVRCMRVILRKNGQAYLCDPGQTRNTNNRTTACSTP
ncbi:MAG: GspH/FimT family pseudopilin [Aquabacterium sp.]